MFITLLSYSLCPPAGFFASRSAGENVDEGVCVEMRCANAVRLFAAQLLKEEAKPKPDLEQLASYNDNLIFTHKSAGRYGKTLEFYQRTLAICVKNCGKGHPATKKTKVVLFSSYY